MLRALLRSGRDPATRRRRSAHEESTRTQMHATPPVPMPHGKCQSSVFVFSARGRQQPSTIKITGKHMGAEGGRRRQKARERRAPATLADSLTLT